MPRVLRVVLWVTSILLLLLAITLGGLLVYVIQDQPQMFSDPLIDTVQPLIDWSDEGEESENARALLVFYKTNGFNHREAIASANTYFQTWSEKLGWFVYITDNSAVFNAQQLARFHVVIFNNTTRPSLTEEQRSAFRQFVESGGGFLGIHAAGDDSHHEWNWYRDQLVRASFSFHTLFPRHQTAELIIEDHTDSSTKHLPDSFQLQDEWYSFSDNPRDRGSHVLLRLDESTYNPWPWKMGEDHPIVWRHNVGKGRAYYTGLGDTPEVFADPRYQTLLLKAVEWLTHRKGTDDLT